MLLSKAGVCHPYRPWLPGVRDAAIDTAVLGKIAPILSFLLVSPLFLSHMSVRYSVYHLFRSFFCASARASWLVYITS